MILIGISIKKWRLSGFSSVLCQNVTQVTLWVCAMQTCKQTERQEYTRTQHTHARTHTQARTYARTHAHARTHARTHTHTHTHTQICTHARTHARTHTHSRYLAHTAFSRLAAFSTRYGPLPRATLGTRRVRKRYQYGTINICKSRLEVHLANTF